MDLWPARLLSPQHSPGKNTEVDSHSLLQGIFPTQGSRTAGRFFTIWATRKENARVLELGQTPRGKALENADRRNQARAREHRELGYFSLPRNPKFHLLSFTISFFFFFCFKQQKFISFFFFSLQPFFIFTSVFFSFFFICSEFCLKPVSNLEMTAKYYTSHSTETLLY